MEKWSPLILNNLCLPCLLPVPFTLMTVLTLIYINLRCKSVTLDWFQDQIALKSNKNTLRHKSFATSSDRIHTRAWTNCMLLAVISLWFYWTHLFNIALLLTGKIWKYFQFFLLYMNCSEAGSCIHLNSLPPTCFAALSWTFWAPFILTIKILAEVSIYIKLHF